MSKVPALSQSSEVSPGDSRHHVVLTALAKPGCLFCHEEGDTLRRQFFWYLAEQYFEAQWLAKMDQSHGFCRRHTRHLLGLSGPSTIGRVYSWMLALYLDKLRAVPQSLGTREITGLLPNAECEMCLNEVRSRQGLTHSLQAALEFQDVRDAIKANPPCLFHFQAIAFSLDWDDLSRTTVAVLHRLGAGRASGDIRPWLGFVWGDDAEPRLRCPRRGELPGGGAVESWSPTLEWLRGLVRAPGCPVGQAKAASLAGYFDWLEREIDGGHHGSDDALHLCRVHAHDFATGWSETAAQRLADATAAAWRARLSDMAERLAHRPAGNLPKRLWADSQEHLRAIGSGTFPVPRALLAALGQALQSPRRRLQELCAISLRSRGCPACRVVQTSASRTVDLLLRSLGDAETRQDYERSAGMCVRDLTLALRLQLNSDGLRPLLRQANTRLDVIQWELQEMQRKEAWDVRYEAKASEHDAWRRAAELWTGSCLESPLVGLG